MRCRRQPTRANQPNPSITEHSNVWAKSQGTSQLPTAANSTCSDHSDATSCAYGRVGAVDRVITAIPSARGIESKISTCAGVASIRPRLRVIHQGDHLIKLNLRIDVFGE